MSRWSARLVLAVALLLLLSLPVWAAGSGSPPLQEQSLWATAIAWFVPIGLGLLACGTAPPERVASVIRMGWMALGVSVIGYWLCGFAFQFGGLGFAFDHPDLAGLVREWTWSPLDPAWGTDWGVLGLEGYLLHDGISSPAVVSLFLSQLPWITTAVAIPLWSLQGRTRPFALFLSSIVSGFVYALVGNWVWGGGWLANLGSNVGLGHGLVDLSGAGVVHLVSGASAFAGMLAFGTRTFVRHAEQLTLPSMGVVVDQDNKAHGITLAPDGETYVPMPPVHLPIFATLGIWLVAIGWAGWALTTPAHLIAGLDLSWSEVLTGLMLSISGGGLMAMLFSWLTTGEGNALMTARGVLGAVVAASAGVAFMPLWSALAVGAAAGLLVPLVQYFVEHVLRLDDPTSAVASHLIPGLWGLLSVGLFADGRAGEGWNQTSLGSGLDTGEQGVTGLLAAAPHAADWPGQFQAQAIGAVAAFLTGFFVLWLLFSAIQSLTRAWRGEYAIRLPRRKPARRDGRPRAARGLVARRRSASAQEPEGESVIEDIESASMPRSWFADLRSRAGQVAPEAGGGPVHEAEASRLAESSALQEPPPEVSEKDP